MATACSLQWKGTDVCLDLWCECGHQSHLDGYFVYHVRCPNCGAVYKMPEHLSVERVEPEDDDLVGMELSESVGGFGAKVHRNEDGRPWRELKRIPSYREAQAAEHG